MEAQLTIVLRREYSITKKEEGEALIALRSSLPKLSSARVRLARGHLKINQFRTGT